MFMSFYTVHFGYSSDLLLIDRLLTIKEVSVSITIVDRRSLFVN